MKLEGILALKCKKLLLALFWEVKLDWLSFGVKQIQRKIINRTIHKGLRMDVFGSIILFDITASIVLGVLYNA